MVARRVASSPRRFYPLRFGKCWWYHHALGLIHESQIELKWFGAIDATMLEYTRISSWSEKKPHLRRPIFEWKMPRMHFWVERRGKMWKRNENAGTHASQRHDVVVPKLFLIKLKVFVTQERKCEMCAPFVNWIECVKLRGIFFSLKIKNTGKRYRRRCPMLRILHVLSIIYAPWK